MRPEIEESWINYFRTLGYHDATGIGIGMEGAVYLLEANTTVAKVWYGKDTSDLTPLYEFYSTLAEYPGAIDTPEIFKIDQLNGKVVTFEKFLNGLELQDLLNDDAKEPEKFGVDACISVLDCLRIIPDNQAFRNLKVLDESVRVWAESESWNDAIIGLVRRRYDRYAMLLNEHVAQFERVYEHIDEFLHAYRPKNLSLLHGDLCGPNILVDQQRLPVSVIDFGFFSMVGDPAFDAAITSSLFNMYGPHAQQIDRQVTEEFVTQLGYKHEVLLAYKAIYAIITSNAYSESPNDGHFQWCARILSRADIWEALGI